jgi:hypothetical protein
LFGKAVPFEAPAKLVPISVKGQFTCLQVASHLCLSGP